MMQTIGLIIAYVLMLTLCIKDPSLFIYFILGSFTGLMLAYFKNRK